LIKDNKVYYLDENYDGKTEEIYEDIDAAYKEGEIGIAALMEMAGNYNRENASVMLDKALWDSYVAILMQEAVNTKERISGDYGNY